MDSGLPVEDRRQVQLWARVELPAATARDERLRLELGELDLRLTRANGGTRAACELAAAYGGERTIVLGFAGVRAVRRVALTKLFAEACRLLEPWAEEGRLELRSLRPAVRRELVLVSAARADLVVVASARRALTLAPDRWRACRPSPSLTANRRRMLLLGERDGERCVWCSKQLSYRSLDATVDHVRCRSAGGSDALENLVLACAACNHKRSNRSAELWLQHCRKSGLEVDEQTIAAAIRRAEKHARKGRRPQPVYEPLYAAAASDW
jgi:5-methylcytosine-specific restriction endonuclease McrA